MKRLLLSVLYRDFEAYADKDVTVAGWIRNIRDSKVFGFIELNDGSCFKSVQVVFEQGNRKTERRQRDCRQGASRRYASDEAAL